MDSNDSVDIELDSIPMPSNSSQSGDTFNEVGNSSIDSWNSSQNYFSPPLFPHAPYFQGFPLNGNNNSGCIPAFPGPYFPAGSGHLLSQNRFPSQMQRQPQPWNNNRSTFNSLRNNLRPPTLNQTAKVRATFPHIQPIRFVISNKNVGASVNSNVFGSSTGNGNASYPTAVRDYIERAYAATEAVDRPKLEAYLKKRVEPLMRSGAVYAVNWTEEPLPHEQNFEVRVAWTPASELKRKYQLNTSGSASTSATGNVQPEIWLDSSSSSENVNDNSNSHFMKRSPKRVKNFSKKSIQAKKVKKNKGVQPGIKIDSSSSSNWAVVDTSVEKRRARVSRFSDAQDARHSGGVTSKAALTVRRQRGQSLGCYQDVGRSVDHDDDNDLPEIVGTCMEVEKKFFRLTAAADPSQVRPLHVLVEALEMIKTTYRKDQNYRYACDQLKSVRQDLMIQNIRTPFTVFVYESNARIALENKDREEFNQCQNQLKQLYKENVRCPNKWEFTAYRLLYYIYMKDILDISSLLDDLLPEALSDECMAFALLVWDAWSMSNYVRLFRLYAKAPKMTGYVMDMFVDRERREFFTAIVKAYRPEVGLGTVATWLAFTEGELVEWLAQLPTPISIMAGGSIDCRQHANVAM